MALVASIPSISGIRTSMRTTSGPVRRPTSIASRPSAASPTTTRSPASSSITRNPERTTGWSSTSTILVAIGSSHPGKPGADRKPPPGAGALTQASADDARPLGHAHPKPKP